MPERWTNPDEIVNIPVWPCKQQCGPWEGVIATTNLTKPPSQATC